VRIFIFSDIEGISGIYTKDQVLKDGRYYNEGRELMTAEINACAEGCKAAGADSVIVRDGHGSGGNVILEKLSPAVDEIICGDSGGERFPGLDECDGLILLGYHAMAGTTAAVLEHSMSSVQIQNYWINGEKAGEIGIDAGISGEHGVPVIMVSGDDKACAEANALLPWAETAQVKRGLSSFGAVMLPPQKGRELVYETAKRAVESISGKYPLTYTSPVHFRVELMERQPIPNPNAREGLTVIDGRTFEIKADTLEQAFFRSW
jgi:D-amino peptidase